MFLYLTLYLQNILDYSPLQAGLRFLPISCLAFISAPISGKLSAQVPIRLLMGGGLALVAVSLWLMTGLTPTSSWTALLPGFIIGGLGIGIVNPALATSAISTVRREQAGVGSGINATFRQVGIATGIAALGAIFQHQVAAYASGHPQLGAALPEASFVSGLNDILWVGFGIAAVGSVLAFVLVRGKDFIASAPEGGSAH